MFYYMHHRKVEHRGTWSVLFLYFPMYFRRSWKFSWEQMKQSHAECQGHDREPSHFSYMLMQTVSFFPKWKDVALAIIYFEVISSVDICLTTLVIWATTTSNIMDNFRDNSVVKIYIISNSVSATAPYHEMLSIYQVIYYLSWKNLKVDEIGMHTITSIRRSQEIMSIDNQSLFVRAVVGVYSTSWLKICSLSLFSIMFVFIY